MASNEKPAKPRPSILWVATGLLLVAGGLGADHLGFGGRGGLGLSQLLLVVVGVALIARTVWAGAVVVGAVQCALVWFWLGLISGFVDVAVKTFASGAVPLHQPSGYYWMIPATCGVAFAVVGVLWAVAGRLFPRGHTLPGAVLVAAVFGFVGVIRLLPIIDELAGILLALGGATALARWAAAQPALLLKTCRYSTALMTVALVAGGGWDRVSTAAREQSLLDALPPVAADARNVLLIVLDTVRGDHVGAHGYQRPTTPALDALSAGGAAFDNAMATAPWTLPSHVSLFTGRYPHQSSGSWLRALDDADRTLAEVFSEHGYATAGFVGNLHYCGAENGIARGFSRYVDYTASPGVLVTSPALGYEIVQKALGMPTLFVRRAGAEATTDHFLQWLGDVEPLDRPFFACINYFDAHAIYDPPKGYDLFGPRTDALAGLPGRGWRWSAWSATEQQGFIDAYDGCLRFIDDQIARVLGELKTRGLLDNTLVVVTGDHGEQFGEHDLKEHASSLYRAVLHVPMIIRLPGVVPVGAHYDDFVSISDVPATILDLVGITPAEPLPGVSLAGAWSGGAGEWQASPVLSCVDQGIRRNPELPFSKGPMKSLFFGGLHYILGGDGREELYDAGADPAEVHDLSGSRPADLARLRAELERVLAAFPER